MRHLFISVSSVEVVAQKVKLIANDYCVAKKCPLAFSGRFVFLGWPAQEFRRIYPCGFCPF